MALVALVLTGCERLFPDVEDWITDSETLARRFDARLGDLKECVEEDNRKWTVPTGSHRNDGTRFETML